MLDTTAVDVHKAVNRHLEMKDPLMDHILRYAEH